MIRLRIVLRTPGTPCSAGGDQRPQMVFSVGTSVPGRVGKNSSRGRMALQADTGSFDCVNGLVSESVHSAQDDIGEAVQTGKGTASAVSINSLREQGFSP